MMFDRLFEKLLTVETRPSGKVEELWLTPKGKLISASPDHTTDALRRMRKMDKNYKGDENDAYDDIKQEKQFIRVYIGELLVDVGFDIASKITVSQYAKIKKLIKEYELVFFDIYNPKTGKGRSDNGGRELIKAIRDYGLLEAKKNCQKEFIIDFCREGCSELVMRELLEKTLALSKETSMNEFDIKKALRTTALAGIIGGAAAGLALQKGVAPKAVEKPTTTVAVEEPAKKVSIDLDKIAEIESSNDPKAENPRTGARGLHQIMKPTWNEVVLKMGVDWSWWDDAFDVEKNTKVADYYMNTEIPRLLKHFGIDDTVENRLAAYNWGVGNLDRAGSEWMEKAPRETLDYIEDYKSL